MSSLPDVATSSMHECKPADCGWSLHHVTGDLFSCGEEEALAHCISQDCRMGAGIAVVFKNKFGGEAELKEQKKVPGQCAVLKRDKHFVYYLITKKKYNHKPTYNSLRQSLEDMKSHCLRNRVTAISMPRIGCGLDRLKWDIVEEMLKEKQQKTLPRAGGRGDESDTRTLNPQIHLSVQYGEAISCAPNLSGMCTKTGIHFLDRL
ncbi:hypothetical protein DPEC_G00010400 [Dallia pectoralis]|uniref:Uncharacterized protein n=1 Tax=Dallia pectoralis TaxID=75939 RepID=A0ACC2HM13_DALPE|nr:hypothetical protein DPEC_G00010400 [Dallia pectoralis]